MNAGLHVRVETAILGRTALERSPHILLSLLTVDMVFPKKSTAQSDEVISKY